MSDLDADVRRFDEDRWLASRFAPAGVRTRLIAIYALNHEIARTADTVSQAAIGDIRLAWWREALAEIAEGKPPRAHPILEAFAASSIGPLPLAIWERLIEARGKDLEPSPFATWLDLEHYIDATAGGVMRIAIDACGADTEAHAPLVRLAAHEWGCTGLLRSAAHWQAKGRVLMPSEGGSLDDLAARARHAVDALRAADVPSAIFPAVGYAALVHGYLRAHVSDRKTTPLLFRQLRLIAASATGRL